MRRRVIAAGFSLALWFGGLSAPGGAQEVPVSLLADRVTYDEATGALTAEGNVEILYEGRVLRASRLVYDERADEVRATGPIVLTDPEGGVLLAEAAALTPDLEEGLIEGARVLIAGQLQLAAAEARRSAGRFVTLDQVVASTCTICAGDPTPTWAIRAARVTQDPLAERIYFEEARLEVFGLPVAYAPRLSVPDPRVERATGFLAPEFLNSQLFGFGARLPYYRVLGPSADMTVTPFLTTGGSALLEGEYRRRFARGGFDVSGVFALDDGLDEDLTRDHARWAFSTKGDLQMRRGFVAEFDVDLASDDVFLKQFDYSDADLLTSVGRIRRTRERDDFRIEVIGFQSLLPEERSESAPAVLPDFAYRRRLAEPVAGGRVLVDLRALGIGRDLGQDLLRLSGGLDWRRDWTLPRGLRLAAAGGAAVDAYRLWDDPERENDLLARATPDAMVELRWPLVRRDAGADHLIEPIVQLVYAESLGDEAPPNEDSALPEFSHANLFSHDRFPGRDRVETGLRANVGVHYLRDDPDGWSLGLTLGRVLRASDRAQFPKGVGLDGRASDYVGEVTLDFAWGLGIANRMLVGSDLEFTRNEFSIAYEGPKGALGASYIYLAMDDSNRFFGPQPETSELALAARYRVLPNWEVRGSWRYDATSGANLRAGGGVTYGNECAEIGLSVSRRYTSSDNLPPATTIGFGLRLAGLGASQTRDWPARACAVAGRG